MFTFNPEKLRQAITDKGINIATIAAQAQLTPSGIYKMLDGQRPNPGAVTLARIGWVLGMKAQDFLDEQDDTTPTLDTGGHTS